MVEGRSVVPLFGTSYYPEVSSDERYLQSITFISGSDFRVHVSSEGLCFTVNTPARDGIRHIDPDPDRDQHLYLYAESFPANSSTIPPHVEILVESAAKQNVAWVGYAGVWRGALVLDCGKDLPEFVERRHALKSAQFLTEVSEALRCAIHEIGEIY